ncbi:MAG: 30S ribosome-binding factor RbfA [Candidatus Omnitrophota bacterium]|nr:30S ribosome-binding factor RbfA [Candidatus Omnitrophota bacterium]
MGIRSERVEEQLKKEISKILQEDIKDPRIGFTTITRIDLTGDLRYARIYFSIMGDDKAKEESLKGIKSSVGFIRKLIAERMDLRYVPELYFKLDNSIEYSINLEKTFERIRYERENSKAGDKEI